MAFWLRSSGPHDGLVLDASLSRSELSASLQGEEEVLHGLLGDLDVRRERQENAKSEQIRDARPGSQLVVGRIAGYLLEELPQGSALGREAGYQSYNSEKQRADEQPAGDRRPDERAGFSIAIRHVVGQPEECGPDEHPDERDAHMHE
jgi:hypothetical protein